MSITDLAEETGMHRFYLPMIERGERNPSYLTLLRLARALRTTVASLTYNEKELHASLRAKPAPKTRRRREATKLWRALERI